MTHESPVPPSRRNGDDQPPEERYEKSGAGHPDRVRESIRKLAQARLRQDISVSELEKVRSEMNAQFERICASEKKLRIERLQLRKKRDSFRAAVIGLRKKRLEKASRIDSVRARIESIRSGSSEGFLTEVERLEKHLGELRSELDAFRETLIMHRRDRDRIYGRLCEAQSALQDRLTERMLWRILEARDEGMDEEEGDEREGLAAELLGRLLVLEKQGSQLESLIVGFTG